MPDGTESGIEKVEIGLATLYRGDSTVVGKMIEAQVDHTITDPPYEAEAHTANRMVQTAEGLVVQAHRFEAMDEETRSKITSLIVERTERWAIIFCQTEGAHYWEMEVRGSNAHYHSTMVWVKPDAKPNYSGNGPGVGQESMVTAWCGDGKSVWNGGGRVGVFVVNKNEERDEGNTHTTIKPQKLMRDLVTLFTDEGQMIFDPFMGSGSTGVAAVALGRKFIGIERDPEYFEICCRRIEEAQRNPLLGGHYVKTRSRLASASLVDFSAKKEPKQPKPKAQGRKPVEKKPKTVKGSRPLITIGSAAAERPADSPDRAAFAASAPVPKRPFVDSFMERNRDVLLAAGAEPLKLDEDTWNWNSKSAVGLDVESFENFFLVCVKRFSDGKRMAFERSERAEIDAQRLEHVLHNNTLVTFNGAAYDVPIILFALKGANCVRLHGASARIIGTGMRPWDTVRELGVAIPPLDHIDLLEPNPSVRQGLKTLAGRLHQRFLVDLPFDPDARLTRQQMNFCTLYCLNDIDSTQLLFEALREPLELRVALSKTYGIGDMRSRSDAQVGEAIVKRRVEAASGRKLGRPENVPPTFRYQIPSFVSFNDDRINSVLGKLAKTDFQVDGKGEVATPELLKDLKIEIGEGVYSMGIGGLHSTEGSRALVSDEDNQLVDLDVASQYPSIIRKLGLYPKTTGPKFLEVYSALIEERMAAKIAKDKVKVDGLKISLNGVYGKLGSAYSFLYAPHMMIATTLTGQLSLLMLIERFEEAGIPVVSGNTDGVVANCPRSLLSQMDKIVRGWEEATGFQVERANYKAIYNSSVNTYIAIKDDGKAKRKGPVADPWTDGDVRGQLSKNPQMTILSEAVLRYAQTGKPLEETIRRATDPRMFVTIIKVTGGGKWRGHALGRVVRFYWSTDGDPITYVKSGNKVPRSDGARPAMELPDALWDDVDYDRYVEEAQALAEDLGIIKGKGLL